MVTRFFLDTNALILLSGANEDYLMTLRNLKKAGKIEIQVSHVQIDEKASHVESDFEKRIMNALSKVEGIVDICPTKEIVFDVSRFGCATFGSDEIHKIDGELRSEITQFLKKKG